MHIPILPRYILKLSLPFFALSLMVFSAVLFMNHFASILNVALLSGASPVWLAKSLLCLSPGVLGLALPMSFLLGLLLTLGGLSERGEIIAMRACGYSFGAVLWPLAGAAVVLSAFLIYLNNWVSPIGLNNFKNSRSLARSSISRIYVQPKTFLKIGDWKIFSNEVEKPAGPASRLSGVRLFRYPRIGGNNAPSGQILRISAPQGRFRVIQGKGLELELKNGQFQQADSNDPGKFILADFSNYKVFIPFAGRVLRNPRIQELITPKLMMKIAGGSLDSYDRRRYKLEISLRFALAFVPVVFFMVGAPLGLVLEKKSRVRGMVLSLVILFAYYSVLVSSINLGRRFEVLSLWVTWTPNILAGLAGIFFWRRNLCSR